MSDKTIKVLLIEDNPGDTRIIREMLAEAKGQRLDLNCCDRLATGLDYLVRYIFDVVLLDLGLPDSQGLDTLAMVRTQAEIPIVVLTGNRDAVTEAEAVVSGAQDYLVKEQVTGGQLVRALSYSVERFQMQKKVERYALEARLSAHRLRKIIHTNADGIIIVDEDGIVRFVNPAAEVILDNRADQLIGSSFGFPPKTGQATEFNIVHSNGQIAIAEMHAAKIKWEDQTAYLTSLRDITKRKQAEEEFQQSVKKSHTTLEETVDALASAIEMRDSYTAGHQRQVARLACAIAKEIGLSDDHIKGIRLAALIHDIGKISIPQQILSKPSRLNDIEMGLIKNHPRVGYEILKDVDFPWPIARIILQHHEKMDASGYPNKLMGEDILLEARVLCVSDIIEAMSSHRPYRPSPGVDKALEEISQNRGILYDPDVVDACLRLFTEKGFEFVQAKLTRSPFRIRKHSSPDVSGEEKRR